MGLQLSAKLLLFLEHVGGRLRSTELLRIPKNALARNQKIGWTLQVLHDARNQVSRQYGISFKKMIREHTENIFSIWNFWLGNDLALISHLLWGGRPIITEGSVVSRESQTLQNGRN